jgi:hypothetical protein
MLMLGTKQVLRAIAPWMACFRAGVMGQRPRIRTPYPMAGLTAQLYQARGSAGKQKGTWKRKKGERVNGRAARMHFLVLKNRFPFLFDKP